MFQLASLSIAAAFLLETSVLGNAFSYYFNLPRWAAVIPLVTVASISGGIQRSPNIDNKTIFFILPLGAFFLMDAAFGFTHALYSIKILILLSFFVMTVRSKEILALSAKYMLLVFNVALIMTAINFLLPGYLLLEPSFLGELRRFDTGDGGRVLYAMHNFGGLLLIGDNPITFHGLTFPRYAGYFTEPAVYISAYLAVAIIVAFAFGLGRVEKFFLVVNLLVSFSVTAAAIVVVFLSAKLWQSRFRAIIIFSLPALLMLFVAFAFVNVGLSPDNYLAKKFIGSGGLSLNIWLDGFQHANFAGVSSFNARIGDFDLQNISIASLVVAYGLFGLVFASFIEKVLTFASRPSSANLLSLTALMTILTLITKAPNHALFSWFSIALLFFFWKVHTRFPAREQQSGLTA